MPCLAKCPGSIRQSIAVISLILLAACASDPDLGQPGYVQGFAGAAVSDDPHAALAGRDLLSQGGTAGDAAAAMFFTLSVTKPASAGLMASGVCLGYNPKDDTHMTYRFRTPEAVRALAAIHARFGSLPWRQVIGRAEASARFGTRLSRTFVDDWRQRPTLSANAIALYGANPAVGDNIQNLDLAGLLGQLRLSGAGAFYNGHAAKQIWAAMETAGIPVDHASWRQAVPEAADSVRVEFGNHHAAFAPFAGTSGPAEARIWPELEDRGREALPGLLSGAGLGADPAAASSETAFVAADRFGGAVACTLTMGRPFGTGQMVAGIFQAAPATPAGGPLLISNKPTAVLLGAFAGAGVPGWTSATALENLDKDMPLADALRMPRAVPSIAGGYINEPGGAAAGAVQPAGRLGRINAVSCPRGLPNDSDSCVAAADPRGTGLAAIAGPPG